MLLVIMCLIQPTVAYNGPYGVEVTNSYVHVDYAKCSCEDSDGYYYHQNITFLNKCPMCGGKLYYECEDYWIEGIWVCSRCDMDFCMVHGRSHDNMGYYLTETSYFPPKSYNSVNINKQN